MPATAMLKGQSPQQVTIVVFRHVGPQPSPPEPHNIPFSKGGGIIRSPGFTTQYFPVGVELGGTGAASVEIVDRHVQLLERPLSKKLAAPRKRTTKRVEVKVLLDSGLGMASVWEGVWYLAYTTNDAVSRLYQVFLGQRQGLRGVWERAGRDAAHYSYAAVVVDDAVGGDPRCAAICCDAGSGRFGYNRA